jgi:hypothetical protein
VRDTGGLMCELTPGRSRSESCEPNHVCGK